MDSICSEDDGTSDEFDEKPDEYYELEEVEEECVDDEEEGRKDKESSITKQACSPHDGHTPTNASSTRSSNDRKIILEFGKPNQKSESIMQRSLSQQGHLPSEPRGSIVSLESRNTAKSRALSVTSKKVEKRIIPDQNIAELMEKQSIQDHSSSSNSNRSSTATLVVSSTKSDKLPVVKSSNASENSEDRSQNQDQMDNAVSALRAALVADSNYGLHSLKPPNEQRKKQKSVLSLENNKTATCSVMNENTDKGVKLVSPEVNLRGSLTDKTLKVVTEKVKQMNSR